MVYRILTVMTWKISLNPVCVRPAGLDTGSQQEQVRDNKQQVATSAHRDRDLAGRRAECVGRNGPCVTGRR